MDLVQGMLGDMEVEALEILKIAHGPLAVVVAEAQFS